MENIPESKTFPGMEDIGKKTFRGMQRFFKDLPRSLREFRKEEGRGPSSATLGAKGLQK